LNLPPVKGSLFKQVINDKVPMIHAFSPELISRPGDWEDQFTIAGFFSQPKPVDGTLPHNLPAGLTEWLQAGERPLYLGFGSIPFPNAEKLSAVIKDILNISSTRIIY